MYTITGRPRAPPAAVPGGTHTSTVRQSSRPNRFCDATSSCGQAVAVMSRRSASSTPAQASTGAGGRNRRAPTGWAAYGTPKKAVTPEAWDRPRTRPPEVRTSVASAPPGGPVSSGRGRPGEAAAAAGDAAASRASGRASSRRTPPGMPGEYHMPGALPRGRRDPRRQKCSLSALFRAPAQRPALSLTFRRSGGVRRIRTPRGVWVGPFDPWRGPGCPRAPHLRLAVRAARTPLRGLSVRLEKHLQPRRF